MEGLREQRSAYSTLFTSGAITEDDFKNLVSEVDYTLVNQEIGFGDLLIQRTGDQTSITHLIAAVIDEEDLDNVLNMLNIMGIPTTTLSSSTGSGRRHKVSMLIGVEENQIDSVVSVLGSCCEKEVELNDTIFDRLPIIGRRKVQSGTLSVYIFEIEHYEEF